MAAATLCEEETSLASQCLAFCQALASQGKAFKFSLAINSAFSFSLDTRDTREVPVSAPETRKKSSPSTRRRNARRRAQFLKKKLEAPLPSNANSSESATPASTPLSSTETTPETLRNGPVALVSRRPSLETSILRQEDSSAVSNSVEEEHLSLAPVSRTYGHMVQCPLGGPHKVLWQNGSSSLQYGDPCPLHPMCPHCEEEDAQRESRLPRACGFHANAYEVADSPCSGTVTEYSMEAFSLEFGFDE